MRIPGLGRLRRVARRARNRFVRSALILAYHRVNELPSDPNYMCVSPHHFAEHMDIIRKYSRPMRLQELIKALREGNLPHRALAVTFDDGYADNLYNAKPLLEHNDIPATVFVTAGYIGHTREFWWDELERLFLQPGILPETLCLNVNGISHKWEQGEVADYTEDAYQRHRCWNVKDKNDPSPRHHLFRSLFQLLRYLPSENRQQVMDELLAWSGLGSEARQTHRTLSPDELLDLAKGRLIEVGAHTVTHPPLSALRVVDQRAEIYGSKAYLEKALGCPVVSFAYPFGSRSDYTRETIAIVRDAGFACACATSADVAWRGSNRFQLPRIVVRDWDGDRFARRLEEWFTG